MKITAALQQYDVDHSQPQPDVVLERHWSSHESLVVVAIGATKATVRVEQLRAALDAVTSGGWGSR